MFRRISFGPAVVLVFVAILTGGTASAATPLPHTSAVLFEGEATNGFVLDGYATPEREGGLLSMRVEKAGESATYGVKGEMTGDRLAFDLGELGKVEGEIRPHRGTEKITLGCGKKKPVKVPTVELVGTIEFHGEDGFSEFATVEVVAAAIPLKDVMCIVGSSEIFGEGLPGTELNVKGPAGQHLWIEQDRPGAAVEYEAQLYEKLGDGVDVTRSVFATAPADVLHFDKKLSKASFHPGAGLVGSATYRFTSLPRGGKAGTGKFIGSLAADFPGRADVPLAGPGFTASINHVSRSITDLSAHHGG
jgi:hypothetical protein